MGNGLHCELEALADRTDIGAWFAGAKDLDLQLPISLDQPATFNIFGSQKSTN